MRYFLVHRHDGKVYSEVFGTKDACLHPFNKKVTKIILFFQLQNLFTLKFKKFISFLLASATN